MRTVSAQRPSQLCSVACSQTRCDRQVSRSSSAVLPRFPHQPLLIGVMRCFSSVIFSIHTHKSERRPSSADPEAGIYTLRTLHRGFGKRVELKGRNVRSCRSCHFGRRAHHHALGPLPSQSMLAPQREWAACPGRPCQANAAGGRSAAVGNHLTRGSRARTRACS